MRQVITYLTYLSIAMLCVTGLLRAQDLAADTLWLAPVHVQESLPSEVYPMDSIPRASLVETSSLVQALRNSGDFYIREYGVGNIANVTLRGGSAQQTSLFWNGLPINSPSLGLSDLSLIPSIFIDEVQIQAGAASQLSGAGGMSGSLMLNSDSRATSNRLRLHQSVSPALGAFTTDVMVGLTNKGWSSRTGIHSQSAENRFKYEDDSGPQVLIKRREHARTNSKGVSQDISYAIDNANRISLHGYVLHADREIPANLGLPNRGETQVDNIARTALSYVHIKKRWQHRLLLGGSEEWQRYRAPQSDIDSWVHTSAISARWMSSYLLREHTILRSRLSYDRLSLSLNELGRRMTDLSGVYAEVDHSTDYGLKVNIGASLDYQDGQPRPLTVSMGMSQDIRAVKGLSVKASGSKNHRDPTLNDRYWPELGKPDLDSEESYSADCSLQMSRRSFNASLGVFSSSYSSLIVWLPSDDGRYRPVNVNESSVNGIEAKLKAKPYEGLEMTLSYSYTDSKVKRLLDEERPSLYQPLHRAFASLHGIANQHKAGFSYAYSSEVLVNYTSSRNYLQSVHSVNLNYRWSPAAMPELVMGLDINNILNRNYQYVAQRPTAGRYVQIHLILKLYHE